jgi:hypothetical protein
MKQLRELLQKDIWLLSPEQRQKREEAQALEPLLMAALHNLDHARREAIDHLRALFPLVKGALWSLPRVTGENIGALLQEIHEQILRLEEALTKQFQAESDLEYRVNKLGPVHGSMINFLQHLENYLETAERGFKGVE